MIKKLNPSFSFLLLILCIEIGERIVDALLGDGDGEITGFRLSAMLTFLQVFFIFLAVLWLPEVWRSLRHSHEGKYAGKTVFERNAGATLLSFVVALLWVLDFSVAQLYFGKQEKETTEKQEKSVRTADHYYHHGLKPLRQVQDLWGDSSYRFITNSLGFKDDSARQVALQGNRKRLLLIGDSFTEGIGLPFHQTFAGLFTKALQDSVEVFNAGCVSYSPKIYYLKTKYLLENQQFKFNELMICIDISDIQDETVYESFISKDEQQLTVNQQNKLPTSNPKDKLQVADKQVVSYQFFKWDRWLADCKRNSFLYYKIEQLFTPPNEVDKKYYEERPNWTLNDSIYEKWGKKGVALAEQNMKKLVELCNQHQIKPTIVIYPWDAQIKANDLHSKQVQIWQQFATKHQIGFINLFPSFIHKKSTGKAFDQFYRTYFIAGDVHWNKAGNQLMADSLLKYWQKR